jgi:hypothetical protein
MNITEKYILPFDISLNFELLHKHYQERFLVEKNKIVKDHLASILECFRTYPNLILGITTKSELEVLKDPIDFLLGDLFPEALTFNEIKAASSPFQSQYFYQSKRFENIIKDAGENFKFRLVDFSEDEMYVLTCNYILSTKYGIKRNYQKPFYYTIPDSLGNQKTYRLTMNADFISMKAASWFKELSEEDIDELLQNVENIALWKEKFPPNSWELKGFVIMTFSDVTFDTIVSDMKSNMLSHSVINDNFLVLEDNFKKFFSNKDLQIGFSKYNKESDIFLRPNGNSVPSFILGDSDELCSKEELCPKSYDVLFNQRKYFTISNISKSLLSEENIVLRRLKNLGFESCIIAPVFVGDFLIGTLEIVSVNRNDLNSTIASKLDVIMPYLKVTSERSIQESKNYIRAIIQKECTAIHPTIFWKFEEEASKYLESTLNDRYNKIQFSDVTFKHVFPLYGQIDIIGSSTVRNNAIKADFIQQLKMVQNIFKITYATEPLVFYKQIILRINVFIEEFKLDFNTTSEEQLLNFLKNEVNPVMGHIKKLSVELNDKVSSYHASINKDLGIIHNKRKAYEDAVQLINLKVSSMLDLKQIEAQKIFPHFFERFKTDGVEHNIYIGQSLVKNNKYDKVYLKNLRLWQLTTMCEMEQEFYEIQKNKEFQLDCASLILVFGNSLSVRFRVDEKKLDVDGAYNARYEIIKKRIDKANIQGTSERVTQKGMLVIVYSQKKDELEYLRYVNYLQAINYLEDSVEKVVLEDLQGVVGLKAIRVKIKYNL